jgi:glycosyltransferase involved in cell wall biosynthesis
MKILYHHRTASKDGQSVHIEEMIHALRAQGHEVRVVEPPAARQASFGAKPGPLAWIRRRLPKLVYELLELAYNVPVYWRLRRAWREFKPDVLYERHHLYLLAGAWLARRTGLPYLLEVNSPLALERHRTDGLALRALAAATERRVWRSADAVLPVTAVLGGILQREGVVADRITVIPNGIDPERFKNYPAASIAKRALGVEGRLVLGFTGFMREWNALERVIDFIARPGTDEWILVLVGDGPARPQLEAYAAERGVTDRVHFTGLVGRDRIRDVVAAFDVALQPAANEYASPLKLFEYLALGRCVIAPAQPNLLEVLEDGVNAVLFDPAEPEGMSRAIERVADDGALRKRLGVEAARLIVKRNLTWHANAARVAAIAEGLAARRGADNARPLTTGAGGE